MGFPWHHMKPIPNLPAPQFPAPEEPEQLVLERQYTDIDKYLTSL
jgi:hypothetical protein